MNNPNSNYKILVVGLDNQGGVSTFQVVEFSYLVEAEMCLNRFKGNSMIHAFAINFSED